MSCLYKVCLASLLCVCADGALTTADAQVTPRLRWDQTTPPLVLGYAVTIDGVRTLAETVEGFVPELPALPFADRIPEPSTIVDDAFDFAAKLLDSQRHFAQELFAAAAPVTSKSPATAPTTKPKPVVATKKSA